MFQPVHEISDKVMLDWQRITEVASDSLRDNFWVSGNQVETLDRMIDTLLSVKADVVPIMNAERDLKLLGCHFRGEKPVGMARTCMVSMRNFFIQPNRDVP